jgi:diaminohydroxyphosphoribosylaminopyrimidine deaminase / 5-amino-6-(5-phosphoribosylamino)uracil reductase
MAESLDRQGQPAWFSADAAGAIDPVEAGAPEAVLSWLPGHGWTSHLPSDDERAAVVDLYRPLCGATSSRPMTLAHLGQSLDGFIATVSGDSQYVTGHENMVHMHRLRALCDAVVVGAGTVAADDPQLTTRLVPGPNPLRVVVDPDRRLSPTARVFTEAVAPTLYVCDAGKIRPGETHVGVATILGLAATAGPSRMRELVDALRARGCARLFVEGGGVTVSTLLECALLDRLQIAVAPIIIGEGRPGIRMAPETWLSACRRPPYRVFRMGGDLLFDCDLRAEPHQEAGPIGPPVARIL